MKQPLILLDFDGVLFNSAYEAYQVCELVAKKTPDLRRHVSFDEFMEFRSHLTDAWQFARLYMPSRRQEDLARLAQVKPDEQDWAFSKSFFAARAELMVNPDWAKLMSPYPFFYQLRDLMTQFPATFKILSTRNEASIRRTLEFFEADGVEICGQERIREEGSKLAVARKMNWLQDGQYVVYIDDMNHHLEPFENQVDLCIHAGWGYDVSHNDSYTQGQAFQVINGFVQLAHG